MTRKKRILTWVAGVAVALGIYIWFFGDATFWMISTRWMAHKSPILKEVPTELTDHSQSTAIGEPLSYLGYSFSTPWGEVDTSKAKEFP